MPVVEFCYVEKAPNESLAELANAPGIESLTNYFSDKIFVCPP